MSIVKYFLSATLIISAIGGVYSTPGEPCQPKSICYGFEICTPEKICQCSSDAVNINNTCYSTIDCIAGGTFCEDDRKKCDKKARKCVCEDFCYDNHGTCTLKPSRCVANTDCSIFESTCDLKSNKCVCNDKNFHYENDDCFRNPKNEILTLVLSASIPGGINVLLLIISAAILISKRMRHPVNQDSLFEPTLCKGEEPAKVFMKN